MVLDGASIVPTYTDVAALKGEAATKTAEFLMNKDAFSDDAVMRKAQGISGAGTALEGYKTTMRTIIGWYENQNVALKTALDSSSQTDYSIAYETKKAAVEELRKKVEEQRELESIRQQQVQSLEQRDTGNYHSSWLGLQRPMKEESRMGLLVAAGFFAVLAIVGIVYVYRVRVLEVSGIPDMGFFRGGFRNRRRYTN
jgi:hypothetical protein